MIALTAMLSSEARMATLTVRDFDDDLKAQLRVRAARNGRSMEAEVRAILRAAILESSAELGFASRIQRRFSGIDDVELELPPRTDMPRATDLSQ
jgi:antitoxin FitA